MPSISGDQANNYNKIVFSADVDRVQSYVFESNRLPEIRGASRQVAELGEENTILDHLRAIGITNPQEHLLYAGGGSVIARLPTLDAGQKLETRLVQAFANATTVVTISCAYREIPPLLWTNEQLAKPPFRYSDSTMRSFLGCRPIDKHQFGHIVSLMALQLRRKKQQKLDVPFTEIMPFAQICESCYTRPAEQIVRKQQDDERGDLVCDICASKWNEGSRNNGRGYWLERLASVFRAHGIDPSQLEYPQDIDELTDGDPVALIYADGDGIGEKLRILPTEESFEAFSKALIAATHQAVCETIKTVGLSVQGKCNWEIITIGGDDVLILIPASYALEFAIQLSDNFTKHMRNSKANKFDTYMSVGFAIGKVKTPVRVLYQGARNALKRAKKQTKTLREPCESTTEACINWHNVIKEGHPSEDGAGRTTRFSKMEITTGRPYTLSDAKNLQRSVAQIRNQGLNSQLYNIASELQQSAARGSLFYYYQRARLRSERRKPFEEIEAIWKSARFPWIARKDDQYTIFLDMLDLL